MIEYEFRCPACRKVYTETLDPFSDELIKRKCPVCGAPADRIYSAQMGYIDWVNPGFHGDEVNLGLGRHFKSAREREDWAKANGYEKLDR